MTYHPHSNISLKRFSAGVIEIVLKKILTIIYIVIRHKVKNLFFHW